MTDSYKVWQGLESHPLGKAALELRQAYKGQCRLSPLLAMSDPLRTKDYLAWAKTLPEGCAVIYRFHEFDAEIAQALFELTRKRHQQFIIRNAVSQQQHSDGAHFTRDTPLKTLRRFKEAHPDALISLAGLKTGNYTEPLPEIDGLVMSSVFKSLSPSAGAPIGTHALKKTVKKHSVPIFALGGINRHTVKDLKGTGIAGIAAIGGLKQEIHMSDNNLIISKEEDEDAINFYASYPDGAAKAELNLRKVKDGLYNAHHTGVPKSMGGKGVGTALVKAMSTDAAEKGYKIIPGCPFVAVWFKRKPEWAEMAALEPEKFKA